MLVQWLSQLLKAKPLLPPKKLPKKRKILIFPARSPFPSLCLLCSHSCWQCGDRHLGKTTGLPRTFAAACRFFVFITTTNRVNELTAGSKLERGLWAGVGSPKVVIPQPPLRRPCAAKKQQAKKKNKSNHRRQRKQPPKKAAYEIV